MHPECEEGLDSSPDIAEQHYANFRGTANRKSDSIMRQEGSSMAHTDNLFHCSFCEKRFSTNAQRSSHEARVHGKKVLTFKCKVCFKAFKYKTNLDNHILTHSQSNSKEDEVNKFKCKFCQKTFPHLSLKTVHEKTCQICKEREIKLSEAGALELFTQIPQTLEISSKGKEIRTFCCSFCTFTCSDKMELEYKDHMLSHEPTAIQKSKSKQNSCNICGEKFLHHINLSLHRYYNHTDYSMQMKCQLCGVNSRKTKKEFIFHLKTHNTATIYPCKLCPMSFTNLTKILEHIGVHTESKRLFCPVCERSKKFTSVKKVTEHCQNTHPELSLIWSNKLGIENPNPIVCRMCSRIFKTEANLADHIRWEHSSGTFKCDKCDRIFTSDELLQKHIGIKHEQAEFKCQHCHRSFRNKLQMSRHLETHKTTFDCQFCSRTFSDELALIEHLRTHNNKHTCLECGKSYSEFLTLQAHTVIQHPSVVLPSAGNDEDQLKTDGSKFQCKACKMEFLNKLDSKVHFLRDRKEGRFKCEICKRVMRIKCVFMAHQRKHSSAPNTDVSDVASSDRQIEQVETENNSS